MDFIIGLPRFSQGMDFIWVIVDPLTKSVHFLLVKTIYNADKLANIYVNEIVRLHGVPVSIVFDRDSKFTSRSWQIKPQSSSDLDALFSNPALYRSLVGALQYLIITRPDISLAVNHSCQHMHSLTVGHFAVVKQLLRFVKGTIGHSLTYFPSSFDIHAFSDSNWAGDISNRKSTLGYCIFLGSNHVSWSAKKQATDSRSFIEAEY
ncbi:uncharacterized protein LOC114299191 [Camellia sinensis]|uniref:uncharacterized protein LOC114299191 n=1 Tax=Camellia sinensis TaxID=4442 RepID=UPI0010355AF1|nr:uncharacterized protein LOC114299191 [Camellia sinensis]